MSALIGSIVLIGAIFGFSIAAVRACDPNPILIKSYYIVWENDWGQKYGEIIEAKNTASAWKKLCHRHPIDRPRHLVSIEEI